MTPTTAGPGAGSPNTTAPHSDLFVTFATKAVSLPVVGPWLRPLGVASVLGAWGYRHLPGLALASARSLGPAALLRSAQVHPCDIRGARGGTALRGSRGGHPVPAAARAHPVRPATAAVLHQRYAVQEGVRYGPDLAHTLDVWRRRDLPVTARAPGARVPAGRRLGLR